MTTYKLNLLLIRLAAEDAAQQAISQEMTRQFATQGVSLTVNNTVLDINVTRKDISMPTGLAVEWTDEQL